MKPTFHTMLRTGTLMVDLPEQYLYNTFYVFYKFSDCKKRSYNTRFLQQEDEDQLVEVISTHSLSWYSQIILRNLVDEDLTHLALLGLTDAHSIEAVDTSSHLYEVLCNTFSAEDEYFPVRDFTKLPEDYQRNFYLRRIMVRTFQKPNGNVGLRYDDVTNHLDIDSYLTMNGYIEYVLVKLREIDKTFLTLAGIELLKETSLEKIQVYRDILNYGNHVCTFEMGKQN